MCGSAWGGIVTQRKAADEDGLARAIKKIVEAYDQSLTGMDERAIAETARAYGGVVRSGKGKLVETIAAAMAEASWISFLGQDEKRLAVNVKKSKIKVPL